MNLDLGVNKLFYDSVTVQKKKDISTPTYSYCSEMHGYFVEFYPLPLIDRHDH